MNYPTHVCRATDEMGDPYRPEPSTCGTCGRSWCAPCHPTPASLCPFCNASGAGADAIPPRQVAQLASGRLAPLAPWQVRPRG